MHRAIVLLVAALTLTACKVEAGVTVTMEPDGSGTIALTVTADKDVVDQAPGLAEDLRFDDATAAGWVASTPAATTCAGCHLSSHKTKTRVVILSRPFNFQQGICPAGEL